MPRVRASMIHDFNPVNVEDAWACRFVPLLQPEILEVLEELFDFVRAGAGRDLGLEIGEIIVYSSRPFTDPLNIERHVAQIVRDQQAQHEPVFRALKARPPRNPESGYSSLHIMMSLPVSINLGDGWKQEQATFEVQVRDVYEDGWGELSHRLGYKRGGSALASDGMPSLYLTSVRAIELNALKAAADAVSQQAALLDRSLTYYVDAAGMTGSQQSVSDIRQDMMRIIEIAPPDLRARVGDAYRAMDAAHAAFVIQLDNEAVCDYYRTAAELFGEVLKAFPKDALNRRLNVKFGMPVRYHLTLEHANAHVRSCAERVKFARTASVDAVLGEAIASYESLLKDPGHGREYAQDATLQLRLGQALLIAARNADERDAAINALMKAQTLAAHDQQIRELGEDHWLPLQAIFEIAKARFLNAEARDGVLGQSFAAAISEGDKAVTEARHSVMRNSAHANLAHKIINNTLYFRVSRANALKSAARPVPEEDEVKIRNYYDLLLRRPFNTYVETHTEAIDTLVRAALFLEDEQKARELAGKNVGKLRHVARVRSKSDDVASVSQSLDPDQRRMYAYAMRVSRPYDDIAD